MPEPAVAERLAGLQVTPVDYDGVPRVTYSHPEVASVGITSKQATDRGYEITEATYDLAGAQKLDVNVITPKGQSKFEVTRSNPNLSLAGMI